MSDQRPIGIFDSGLGGLTVLNEIRRQMPNEHLIYYGDSANNPYGNKSLDFITQRCLEICRELVKKNVKAIVVACNTATSACIELLRREFDIPVIGMEPALKPAVHQKNHQKVAIWATENTLKEKKFERLLNRYGQEHEIRKVPTPKLVDLAENQLAGSSRAEEVLKQYLRESDWESLDGLVLGCTHFLFFKDQINEITNKRLRLYDGHQGTVNRLKDQLEKRNSLSTGPGSLEIWNSNPDQIEKSILLLSELQNSSEKTD